MADCFEKVANFLGWNSKNNKKQPIENNKANNVSGDKISSSNVNLGKQGDVVNGVGGDFIKGNRDIIKGDRGGDGGDSYHGGFAGAGGPAKGNNTFNYGQK